MITDQLFEKVLIEPAQTRANRLSIISGYASAAFAGEHLEKLLNIRSRPTVKLIVGMFPQISNLYANHLAFKQLSTTDYPLGFECRYIASPPPVHAKAYSWFLDGTPHKGFVGSANYTWSGFLGPVREAITPANASEIQEFFDELWETALDCREREADELVSGQSLIVADSRYPTELTEDSTPASVRNLDKVTLSLLSGPNEIHSTAGLNWGQRDNRERNQAYLPVPTTVGRQGFFPPLKRYFTMMTDDNKSLICVPAQPKVAGGSVPHAIHTPLNNSDLGLYFRNRLGLASGEAVTVEDLEIYGRTDVDIYKIDEETFFLDFSVD